tara:strand:+ start:1552 stop:2535 length:984 start_codon:yes stop_codon:yes gene_type:complete
MENQPLISILMPAKNAAPWLEECLTSILSQRYTNWELWAVNDFSSDHSFSILEDFSKKDKRIHWLQNNAQGIIPALELAYQHSKGTFITRMDADDKMPENKLEILLSPLLDHPNAISTGKVQYFSEQAVSEGYQLYENWLNELCDEQSHWKWIYRECVIASPNWMVHRSTLESIGGFSALNYPEDYDLVLKWYAHNLPIISQQAITLLWREHPKRTSRNSSVYDQDSFFELKLSYWCRLELQPMDTVVLFGDGVKAQKTADFLHARNIAFEWLTLHPNAHQKSFQTLSSITNPKVLSAVYPEPQQRKNIIDFFHSCELEMGKNYWFL